METYRFYFGYSDIWNMKNSEFLKDSKITTNTKFNPPYIEVEIPAAMTEALFLLNKSFIINKKSIHLPTKIITVSHTINDNIQEFINKYNALSYIIEDDKIKLEIPL